MKFISKINILIDLLKNNSYLYFLSIIAHQICVALSILVSVELVGFASRGELNQPEFIESVSLFVILMTLPYVISYYSDILKEKWVSGSLSVFWLGATDNYKGSTDVYSYDKALGVYVSSGKEVIGNFINYLGYGMSSLLNFVFSSIAIVMLVEGSFFYTFSLSLLLVLLINVLSRKGVKKRAKEKVLASSLLSTQLSQIQNNAHYGCYVNFKFYFKKLSNRIDNYLKNRINENRYRSLVVLATSLSALIPTGCLVVFLLVSYDVSVEVKLAILINLTRIFHLLNSSVDVISFFVTMPTYQGQLELLEIFSDKNNSGYNRKSDVTILKEDEPFMCQDLDSISHGRYQVVGKNGSGKSTYLRKLRDDNEYLYFNPSRRVEWSWDEDAKCSDGQYSYKALKWLLENSRENLLLDEWDAFLDIGKTREINDLISRESEDRVIFEVRQILNKS